MSLIEVYWRALRYLAEDRKRAGLICAANVMLAVVAIAEPILFGRVIQSISESRGVFATVGLWAGLGVFNIVAFVLVSRGADRLANLRRADVLARGFEQVISMPLSWHHERGTSQALQMLLRAVETLFSLWLEFMRTHRATAVALVLLVPTAIAMDWRMSAVLLVLGVAYVGIGRLVMRRTKEGQTSIEQHVHRVYSHVADSVSNVAVLQSYNRLGHETNALREYIAKLISAQFPVLDWWALASALNRLASTISLVVVLAIGAWLVQRGELRIAEVIAFIGFAQMMIGRLDQLTNFVNQIFDARVKLEQFYRLEEAATVVREPLGLRTLENVEGDVRFENVSFDFANARTGVKNINFHIRPGQTVAIVGPSGAGKTTLINLLQRVHTPQTGRILVDGVDIRTVTKTSLRHAIASVFQDAGLLNRSIEDNIRVGRANASYDEIHRAAHGADAQEYILGKSEGYDPLVGERGGQLSGGERQRIAIARAILKDAPVLVLDEATSALDVETEGRVKEALDRLRTGRTTFIIAHRLTTVRDADLVIFMDKGEMVEMGGFAELASTNGRFAALLRAGGLLNDEEVRRLSRLAAVKSEAA